jgi:hypothetical protein
MPIGGSSVVLNSKNKTPSVRMMTVSLTAERYGLGRVSLRMYPAAAQRCRANRISEGSGRN